MTAPSPAGPTPADGSPRPLLRRGRPSDAPSLLALFDEAVAWLVERGRRDQWGSESFSARPAACEMVDRFAASDGLVVAVQTGDGGERVVGAVLVEPSPPGYVAAADEPERYVQLLITSRRERGRGLGDLLLRHAVQVCRGDGVPLLRVDCFGGGERELVGWYERQGFVATHAVDVDGWPGQVLEQRVALPRFDELRTARLLLRHWTDADREPYAALNADPEVMRHFPGPMDRGASDAMLERMQAQLTLRGWGLWAVQRRDTGELIGFTGLNPADGLPASPAVEVGWRLAHQHWGQGFAPEAAAAALDVAFDGLGLDEVVSFTTTRNANSRRVMTKLGLTHRPERDFDHPRTPGWQGQRHVLYAIDAATWRASGAVTGTRAARTPRST